MCVILNLEDFVNSSIFIIIYNYLFSIFLIFFNYEFFKAVEETFEQELHQAILLSKLAYEEQLVTTKIFPGKTEKEQEQNKKSGKKSKKATMSLEEFNSMGTNVAPTITLTNESADNKSKGMIM